MATTKRISDSEMVVMRVLWQASQPMTGSEVLRGLPAEVRWKTTTVNTFLQRLVKGGWVTVSHRGGRTNYYAPAYSEQEYAAAVTNRYLGKGGIGSVQHMIASLYRDGELSGEDMQALRQWFLEDGYDADTI